MKALFASAVALAAAILCSAAPTTVASEKALFIDVHELGRGKVTAAGVADAHRADLAIEAKHDVRFLEYWVDEEHGRIYCLSEARSAADIAATHREAHGLLPARIMPVVGGVETAKSGLSALYLDVHEFGPGNVSAKAVAEAHQKDLAQEAAHGVRFLNYWVDESRGEVFCLSEAPDPESVIATHRAAHGLVPKQVVKVTAGN